MANIMTPKFRVSFPNLFKPRKNDMSGKMEYGVMALFSKGTDLSKLQAAVKQAVEQKWGTDQKKWPKDPETGKVKIRMPFRKHEEKRYENDNGDLVFPPGMEEGGIFINLKSIQKPGVVDQDVQDIINESDVYAGCYARATVSVYAYETKGNCGVSFGLQNLQKMGEGDPLGSRTKPQDDFAPIAGAGASEGATADSIFN